MRTAAHRTPGVSFARNNLGSVKIAQITPSPARQHWRTASARQATDTVYMKITGLRDILDLFQVRKVLLGFSHVLDTAREALLLSLLLLLLLQHGTC